MNRRRLLLSGSSIPTPYSAWSLRKVNPNYTGAAIQVRRSIDNAVMDIGFVGNDLDVATLLSFVGSGNGYVRRLYDQYNNRHFKEDTAAGSQPQIVSNGTLITQNGNPAMLFDGSNDGLSISSSNGLFNFLHNDKGTIAVVVRYGNSANPNVNYTVISNAVNFSNQTGFVLDYFDFPPTNDSFYFSSYRGVSGQPATLLGTGNTIAANTQTIQTVAVDNQNAIAAERAIGYVNDQFVIKNNIYTNAPNMGNASNVLILGHSPAGSGYFLKGTVQEVIIWDKKLDGIAVNNYINQYWGVY